MNARSPNYSSAVVGILLFFNAISSTLADGINFAVAEVTLPIRSRVVAEPRPHMLPDGEIANGNHNILAAWLTGPTGRYRHGVLGDAIEASGIAVELADGRILSLELGFDSVFEDRLARLADLNGDEKDEIIVVRSYLDAGAALAIVGIRNGRLAILAESAPIGLPNRWLNPIGAEDFDGDGKVEIALVRTPHIGGILILYRWENDRLKEAYREHGFSNHAMGSRELGLSAILDVNADGISDIALPDASRRNLRIVTFAGARFRNIGNIPHDSRIISKIQAAKEKSGEPPALLYSLADGTSWKVTRER
ncbi:MAG: VCBS repeat-containing protein [Rhodospirillales bacterium]|nr:VCBS repeat-containing protein [Rhodospirillales bacterium]